MADVATPTVSEAESTRPERMTVRDPRKVQLFSAATANGIKVAAALEEIKAARARKGDDFDYEPHTVRIRHAESRMDFFRELNPHGKVPVITHDGHTIFESGAILFYLAEKFNDLLPLPTDKENSQKRYSSIAWFQWGSAEFSRDVKELGYYYKYCKKQEPFPLQRCSEKVKRHLAALEAQLASHHSMFPRGEHFIAGLHYSIADLAIWPWLWALAEVYDDVVTTHFDRLNSYPNVAAYKDRCLARPASRKAVEVCHLGDV